MLLNKFGWGILGIAMIIFALSPAFAAPVLTFVSPTETNASVIYPRTYGIINTTIDSNNLSFFKLNWNGTNYTYFDDNTVFLSGMDNNSAIGENRTKFVDISKYSNNGTYYLGTFFDGTIATEGKWNTSGYFSSGLTNNGSVAAATGLVNSSTLNKNLSSWTVTVWIKPFSNPLLNYGSIWALYSNPYFGRLWVKGTTNEVVQRFGANYEYPGLTLTNNAWTHLAYVCNSSNNATVYANGTLGASILNCLTGNYTSNLTIGENPNAFNGTIDALRLYPWALNASEISQDMVSSRPLSRGALIDYEFEEGTGTTASDTNNIVSGMYDGAARFNGISSFINASVPTINKTSITISMWIYPISSGHGDAYNNIDQFYYKGNATDSIEIGLQSDNKIQVNGNNENGCTSTATVNLNQWNHILFTRGSTSGTLYINGISDATCTTPTSANYSATSWIGGSGLVSTNYFNGSIGEVKILKTSLSAAEAAIYYKSNLKKFNSTQYQFYSNRSSLASSSYTFYAWANATDASSGQSETRIFYTKPYNTLTLSSSAGWSPLLGSVSLSCSALEGTPVLRIDGSTVVNPYTFVIDTGTYSVVCNTAETSTYAPTNTTNTLSVATLASCTNSSTYAFNATITTATTWTTINMTSFVNSSLVKRNLSDVYAENVSGSYVNLSTPGQYYFVVNNTGLTNFTLRFGNYVVNNNYTSASAGNYTTISTYYQSYVYGFYNLFDEVTGALLYPPNSTILSYISCYAGQEYFTVTPNDTKFLVAFSSRPIKVSIRVQYSASSYYTRNRYPSYSDQYNFHFYVADALQYALDRIDFTMADINYYDTELQVYKVYGNSSIIVTENYFDTAHQASEYLMEDSDYYIRTVSSTGAITEFGKITVVEPMTKTLSLQKLYLSSSAQSIYNHVTIDGYLDSSSMLVVRYLDDLTNTSQVNISITYKNGTMFSNQSFTGSSSILLTYNLTNLSVTDWQNETFWITVNASQGNYGFIQESFIAGRGQVWDLGLSIQMYWILSVFIILAVFGVVARETLIGGVVIGDTVIIILMAIGWFPIPLAGLAFIIILSILAIVLYNRQGGE